MTKILIFASANGTGLSHNLTEVAIGLNKKGNEIVVVASDQEQFNGLSNRLLDSGVNFYKSRYIDSYNPFEIIKGGKFLYNVIKSENVDIIHANAVSHLLIAYLGSKLQNKGIKLVLTLHSLIPFYMKVPVFLKIISKITDLIVTVCEKTSYNLIDMGIPSKKVLTIYNGIKIDSFNQYHKKLDNSNMIIGYTANLFPWKGHEFYLDAASKVIKIIPDVNFWVIGDGPLREDLRNKVKELGITENVTFLGQVRNDQILEIISAVDICVSSSLTEQFPYSLLEFMAAGKPIVATNVGCVYKMVINNKTGFLVPPYDSERLADAILKLIQNPDNASEFGKNANLLFQKNFTLEKMINNLESVYDSLKELNYED